MAISKWYIDAWAVRDGAAFASRREFNSREAENTVFIAVPDLEPVPVGRLATALSATRRNFQAGLWNEKGVEIAFESLEQIAELVRRAFLASGLGPGGSAAPLPGGAPQGPGGGDEGSPPKQSGGSPHGVEHYEKAVANTETWEWRWRDDSKTVAESLKLIAAVSAGTTDDSVDSKTIPHLLTLADSYAESITIDWEWRVRQYADPLDTKMLEDWYCALREAGVWSNNGGIEFVETYDCVIGKQSLFNLWYSPGIAPRVQYGGLFPCQHLLSHAPCPRRPAWAFGLSRFADKVTLPMCVGDYFEYNCFLPELAPSVLGAILLNSGGFPSSLVTRTQFRHARLAVALRWIAEETPRIQLPFEAESLVNNYAWEQLTRRSPDASDLLRWSSR